MRRRDHIARAIVRLYPRAWRARYEDELLALVEASPLNVGTIVDLIWGALRERARASVRIQPQPVSIAREIWRDLLRDLLISAAIALTAWVAVHEVRTDVFGRRTAEPLVFLVVLVRVAIVFARRYFIEHRASIAKVPVAPADLLKPALTTLEYGCLLGLIGVNVALYLASGSDRSLSWLAMQTYMIVSLLNSATLRRLEFSDAQKAIRFERRRSTT